MKGYQLSRRWWDWCFQNAGHHTPTHAALYHWYVEACNRVEWATAFEMAPQYAMAAVGVRSYNTYKDALADLQRWGFVRIRKIGANQYVPWLLALSNFDEPLNNPLNESNQSALSNFDIPLNKARNKASDKAGNNPSDAYTINNKPETLKPETLNSNAYNGQILTLSVSADSPMMLQTSSSSIASAEVVPLIKIASPAEAKMPPVANTPQSPRPVQPITPETLPVAPPTRRGDPFYRSRDAENCNIRFSDWFAAYGQQTAEDSCKAVWVKLTDEERQKAWEHTPLYLQADAGYIMRPFKYLTDKHFNCKIVNRHAANTQNRTDQDEGRGAVLPRKQYTKQSFRRNTTSGDAAV